MNNAASELAQLESLRSFFAVSLEPEMIAGNLVISGEDGVNLRLRALREIKGLSVEKFAAVMGVSDEVCAAYEFRGRKVSDDFLETAADKFSVDIDWLKCRMPFAGQKR